MASSSSDVTLKFIIIGDSGVGKSSLTYRFINDIFLVDFAPTLGVDFKYTSLVLDNGQQLRLQLWDTAGQESFLALTKQFYRGSNAALICYDITHRTSFTNVHVWLEGLRSTLGPDARNVPVVLVGCKRDLADESSLVPLRQVSEIEAKEWAQANGLYFFETSSKQNFNVHKVFSYLATKVLEGPNFRGVVGASPMTSEVRKTLPPNTRPIKTLGGGTLSGSTDSSSKAPAKQERCSC
jgi:small GTP-binding protein